jgi:glycosyltransferase involved in cell wall biosynthesis
MSPTVSINLCCYNSEKYLEQTFQSIFAQTYEDWELVVINDGSSDSTEKIIQRHIAEGRPIVHHYQGNAGLGYSRNKAIGLSHGKYIALIDHDDLWLPAKLEKQVKLIEEHPEADILYGNFYKIIMPDENRLILGHKKRQPEGNVFESFLYHYPLNLQTVLFRRSALDRLDHFFDEKLKLAEDIDFFMRLLYESKIVYMHEPLAVYRKHNDMSSIKYIDKYPQEMKYAADKLFNLNSDIGSKYKKAFHYFDAKNEYLEAKALMAANKTMNARKHLRPYRSLNCKFFFLYLLTFFPHFIWIYIHRLKDRGVFS